MCSWRGRHLSASCFMIDTTIKLREQGESNGLEGGTFPAIVSAIVGLAHYGTRHRGNAWHEDLDIVARLEVDASPKEHFPCAPLRHSRSQTAPVIPLSLEVNSCVHSLIFVALFLAVLVAVVGRKAHPEIVNPFLRTEKLF